MRTSPTTISYARTSTLHQNVEQQTTELIKYYPHIKISYEDQISGSTASRPELDNLKNFVINGDTVICYDISRLGRNTMAVLELVEFFKVKGVHLIIKTLDGIDLTSPTGNLILSVMASVATMERELMLEKQSIGISTAKALGKFKGRKANPLTEIKCIKVEKALADKTLKLDEALKAFEISRPTYYRWKKSNN